MFSIHWIGQTEKKKALQQESETFFERESFVMESHDQDLVLSIRLTFQPFSLLLPNNDA